MPIALDGVVREFVVPRKLHKSAKSGVSRGLSLTNSYQLPIKFRNNSWKRDPYLIATMSVPPLVRSGVYKYWCFPSSWILSWTHIVSLLFEHSLWTAYTSSFSKILIWWSWPIWELLYKIIMASNAAAFLVAEKTPLQIKSTPYPTPKENELVVKTAAVAINPVDYAQQMFGPAIFNWLQFPGKQTLSILIEIMDISWWVVVVSSRHALQSIWLMTCSYYWVWCFWRGGLYRIWGY